MRLRHYIDAASYFLLPIAIPIPPTPKGLRCCPLRGCHRHRRQDLGLLWGRRFLHHRR